MVFSDDTGSAGSGCGRRCSLRVLLRQRRHLHFGQGQQSADGKIEGVSSLAAKAVTRQSQLTLQHCRFTRYALRPLGSCYVAIGVVGTCSTLVSSGRLRYSSVTGTMKGPPPMHGASVNDLRDLTVLRLGGTFGGTGS